MIKVIASDLDGTLLNKDHRLDQYTLDKIKEAQSHGIRFVIVTGRDYAGALSAIGEKVIDCDYIVASGAEVRDSKGNILLSIPIDREKFPQIYDCVKDSKVSARFCAIGVDYIIGEQKEIVQDLINEARLFTGVDSEEEIRKTDIFKIQMAKACALQSLDQLMKVQQPIYKVFITSVDLAEIKKVEQGLKGMENIAVASSFYNNIELTDIKAQKGPILKEYIEMLGYQMDEVMAIGDSMNDYSMLSMNFGLTVAMGNATEELKKVAKVITKSNEEHGVAFAIDQYCFMRYI